MLATASRIQLQRPSGMSGSSLAARARAAAPVPAARLGAACPALAAPCTSRRAERRRLRVAATAAPEKAEPVKLTGDDLKEANRKGMRTVRALAGRWVTPVGGMRGGAALMFQPRPAAPAAARRRRLCHHSAAQSGDRAPAGPGGAAGRASLPLQRRGLQRGAPPTPAPWHHPSLPPNPLQLPNQQVFDFELWKKHRSSSRYLRHIVGLGESRIVSAACCLPRVQNAGCWCARGAAAASSMPAPGRAPRPPAPLPRRLKAPLPCPAAPLRR